jgi:hypothetical protein
VLCDAFYVLCDAVQVLCHAAMVDDDSCDPDFVGAAKGFGVEVGVV